MDEKIIKNAKITEMTNMGAGITKDSDGKTVFVIGGADGDVCDIKITSVRSSFAFGVPISISIPSPYRINPDCAAFEVGCGGCSFRHVTYSHELEIKQNYVASLLNRAGANVDLEHIFSAGEYEPRTKVTVPIGKDGSLGYYKNASHSVVKCEKDCRIHSELTNRILSALNELFLGGTFHHVCLRHATHGTMLILIASKDESERANDIFEVLREKFPEITSGYFCRRKPNEARGNFFHLGGDEKIHDVLTGCDFAISPDAFYQVNHGSAERLYSLAAEYADVQDGETVADLYCGTGTIGISVLKNSGVKAKLYGIEIVESAVRDARENAVINGIDANFVAGDAATFDKTADVVIVDPPRAGCDSKLISHLKKIAPSRIIYISCDPATLARDIAALSDTYVVKRAATVDMFPRTSHVETVVCLSREKVDGYIDITLNIEELGEIPHTPIAEKPNISNSKPKIAERKTYGVATYPQIKEYILEKYGLKVPSSYIAQVKDECGIKERKNYNMGKDGHRQPSCTPEKREAILDAFRHFHMITAE